MSEASELAAPKRKARIYLVSFLVWLFVSVILVFAAWSHSLGPQITDLASASWIITAGTCLMIGGFYLFARYDYLRQKRNLLN
jgi:polyferredoxin